MAGITLKGEVKFKGETVHVTDTFSKRELWIEIDQDTDYPQTVNVEFIKDKCTIIDKYSIGDIVEVDVNIRGNVATMKDKSQRCFNSMNGWRIAGTASGGAEPYAGDPASEPQSQVPEPEPEKQGDADVNDLPF